MPVSSIEKIQTHQSPIENHVNLDGDSPSSGEQDEDNWSLNQGKQNEPEHEPQLGEDGESDTSANADVIEGDALVDVLDAIDNFNRNAEKSLSRSTKKRYVYFFENLAEFGHIDRLSRRQLSGEIGHKIIADFLRMEVKDFSRKYVNSGLKTFWTLGLGFKRGSYPVDLKADLGRQPKYRKRQSPDDYVVIPWIDAMDRDDDRYRIALVRTMLQINPRPANLCSWDNRHVVRDVDGKPYAIRTAGDEEGNKTFSPTIVRLSPDMVQAIEDIQSMNPNPRSEYPLFPYRDVHKVIHPAKRMTTGNFGAEWNRFRESHGLNPLLPVYVRHWGTTTCSAAKLSNVAIQAMHGQEMGSGEGMTGKYDQRSDRRIFDEQEKVIPYGPIGVVKPKVVEIDKDVPRELIDGLSKVWHGDIKFSQYAETLMAAVTKHADELETIVMKPKEPET